MIRDSRRGASHARATFLSPQTQPRRSAKLAAAITVALSCHLSAYAQEAPVEEVVVNSSPIKDSLAASIEVQRESVNVVNAIAADAIGRFPDNTAAAALTRLPAVAVQRDQGQERYIQIRGAPQHWTAVAFNGVNVIGAEDRVFRFDSVPAVLIDSVQLNKTLTPDMPAEALAGRVDIKTYAPLDHQGWQSQVDAAYGYVDLAGGDQEQYSARFSNGGERWGWMVAGSHFQFDQEADNAEPTWASDGSMARLRTAKYQTQRETNSVTGRLQFAPSDEHRFSLTSLYTEFLDHELRNQYTFNFASAASGTKNATSGSLIGVPVEGLFEEGDYSNSIFFNALEGEHQFGSWQANWQLAHSKTEDETDLPLIRQTQSNVALRPSVDYSISDPQFPQLSLYDTVRNADGTYSRGAATSALDQQGFEKEDVLRFGMNSESTSTTGKFDLKREWSSLGAQANFKVGLQYDDRKLDNPGNEALLRPDGSPGGLDLRATAAALGVAWTPLEFVTNEQWDEDFNRGYSTNYINNPAMRTQYDALIAAARAANDAGTGNYAVPTDNRELAYEVQEEITATYAMNTWDWGRHSLLVGARMERVDITSEGAARVNTSVIPVSLDNSYTDVFPSAHWNWNLTDTLKFRLSAITGAARPGFEALRANVTVTDSDHLVEGGNPELEPETARGFDTSLEWYFDAGSMLAANAFYRDVQDVLFESTTKVGDDRYGFDGVDRSDYDYETTLNGEDGELYGMELTYYHPWTFLPGFLKGFGFQGSLSFIDGSFTNADGREVDFPGTSDQVANLTLFYEDYGVSVRLTYQYRSDWIDAVGTSDSTDLYWEATERVDLAARYQLNDNFALYLDAVNLTDELGVRYQGNETHPIEIEGFGRRYLLGARVNF